MTPTKEIFEVVKPLSNFVETTFSLAHQSLFPDDPLFSSTSLTCDDGCSCRITDSHPPFSSTSLTCDDGCSCRITDSQKNKLLCRVLVAS